MNINTYEKIPNMDSVTKIYQFFRDSSYETLPDNFRVSKEIFNLRQFEKDSIKEIYIIANYQKKVGIYLVVMEKCSMTVLKSISESMIKEVSHPLVIFTADFINFHFVFLESRRIDVGKFEQKKTILSFNRQDLKHTDKLILRNLALTPENLSQVEELKNHGITTPEELKKRGIFFFHFLKDVFSIEKVTNDFFRGYEQVFNKLKSYLLEKSQNTRWSHHFAHQLLNRLMFLYFIQKKEWLAEDPKFMINFYKTYNKTKKEGKVDEDSFYENWLCVLFFFALCNKPAGCHREYFPKEIRTALKIAPHLNGGLFNKNDLDFKLDFTIPDSFFDDVFEFFERYNFTIREELPLEVVVAVDPEMIGKVYESLVNVSEGIAEKGEAGIFYTARTEIDFMCRRSLVQYLSNHIPDISKEIIYDFIFAKNENEKQEADNKIKKQKKFNDIATLLENITVVDPACGSGSFLVGMLNILADLLKRAYAGSGRIVPGDFEIKKQIIGKSLYGVDIKEWAVHVAELRLWLQLIIETEMKMEELHTPKPLLPNLSFHLRVGDSLVPDIGGFNIYRKALDKFAPSSAKKKNLQNKIRNHKIEKKKYYDNETPRKYLTKEDAEKAEINLITSLIDEEIAEFNDELKNIEKLLNKQIPEKLDLFHDEKKFTPIQTSLTSYFREEEKKRKGELLKEIENLKALRQEIIKKGSSAGLFVWDLAFVEIFSSDKSGFDIVIGNPPYVRQEKIAPPNVLEEAATTDQKKKYKERLFEELKIIYNKNEKEKKLQKIDKKSDLYIYFYFMGLSLLNKKGVFCFITSNSWLDVGYGKDLQEFLLKYTKIHAIYDNSAKRSFSRADVNTIIALFSPPIYSEKETLPHIARFVQFRKPFEEVITSYNLKEIEKMAVRGYLKEEKTGRKAEKDDEREKIIARVVPMTQQKLLLEGWDFPEEFNAVPEEFNAVPEEFNVVPVCRSALQSANGSLSRSGENLSASGESLSQSVENLSQSGENLSGSGDPSYTSLRACRSALQSANGSLAPPVIARSAPQSQKAKKKASPENEKEAFILGKKTGIPKTGKFVGDKWGGKYLRAPDIYFTILEKGKDKLVRLGDIAQVRRGFTTGCNEFFYLPSEHFDIEKTPDGKYWKLIPKHEGLPDGMMVEEEFLKPVVKSSRECEKILVDLNHLKYLSFYCIEKDNIVKNKKAYDYIKWGVSKKYNEIPSVSNRVNWWSLGQQRLDKLFWIMTLRERLGTYYYPDGVFVDARLYTINTETPELLGFVLNSSLTHLIVEILGRPYGGGGGPIDIKVYEVNEIKIVLPKIIKYFDKNIFYEFAKRKLYDIFTECGFNPNLPIRQQEPNPLPDRKALDDIVFDILELTNEERKEVYWSVCELVKARLDKAKSV